MADRLVRQAANRALYYGYPSVRQARQDALSSSSSLTGALSREPNVNEDLAMTVLPPTTQDRPGVQFQEISDYMNEQQNRVQ